MTDDVFLLITYLVVFMTPLCLGALLFEVICPWIANKCRRTAVRGPMATKLPDEPEIEQYYCDVCGLHYDVDDPCQAH